MFLLYINDITDLECITSTVKLYAEDRKIYREIIDPTIVVSFFRMISTTLASGLVNGSYVLMRINANLCELRIYAISQKPIIS